MAVISVTLDGDGSNNKNFTFPSYQESDIYVKVDNVLKTSTTHYNISNYTTTGGGTVVFTSGNIPASGTSIKIYRQTNIDNFKAVYAAGSSIKAEDLNNVYTQLLYSLQEKLGGSAGGGGTSVNDGLHLPDNIKLTAGGTADTPDFELLHNGSLTSLKEIGTGNLVIDSNSAVELHHAGVKKLETISDGIKVSALKTGVAKALVSDSITGIFNEGVIAVGPSDDLKIFYADDDNNTAANYIQSLQHSLHLRLSDSGSTSLTITGSAGQGGYVGDIPIASFQTNGACKLWHNAAASDTNATIETTSGGVTIRGALTAGGLTYPTTNGSNGQRLTSNGSGSVIWADDEASVNTTYDLGVPSGSTNIRLTGSDSSTDNVTLAAGSGIGVSSSGNTITFTNTGAGEANLPAFSTIAVSGQSNVVADSTQDTLSLVAGSNIAITTDASGDSVTIASTISDNDTTYSISCVDHDSNASQKKIRLTAGGAGSGTDDVALAAGAGLGISRSSDVITFTNTQTFNDNDTTYTIGTGGGSGSDNKSIILTAGGSGSGTDSVYIKAGTNLTIDESGDTITLNNPARADQYKFKTISVSGQSDVVADAIEDTLTFVAGNNVSLTTSNEDDSVTINAIQLTTEEIQDLVGAMVSGNTETNITVTYDDSNGKLDFVSSNTQLSVEEVQDIVGGMVGSNTETNITVTYDDTNGKLDFVVSGGEVTVQDEGSALSTAATTLNFVGDGVTATGTGATKTITIPGGSATNFKYLELKAHNNTSGAFSAGSADYELVTAGTTTAISPNAANALLISINGVIQEPNTGTSIGSNDGFCIDGSSIHFGANLTEHPNFIIYLQSAGIGTPSDNTVTTAHIVNGTILNEDINASAAIGLSKLATGALPTGITVASANIVDGTIATADIGADQITGALIADDAVGAEHIEDLDANVKWVDNSKAVFGTGSDFEIYHDGTNNYLVSGTGLIRIRHSAEDAIITNANGAVEIYYDNAKKLETSSTGISVTGDIAVSGHVDLEDDKWVKLGTGDDFQLGHTSNLNYIDIHADLLIRNDTEVMMDFNRNAGIELWYDGSKKFETKSNGVEVTGKVLIGDSAATSLLSVGGSNYNWTEGDVPMLLIEGYNNEAPSSGSHNIAFQIKDENANLIHKVWNEGGGNSDVGKVYYAGDVGIGTTNPTSDGGTTLEIYNATNPTLKLNDGDQYKSLLQLRGNDLEIRGSNGQLEFYTGSADGASSSLRGRFTDDGNFQINNDSGKIQLGASQDLQIYHDGTNTIIDNNTGEMHFIGGTTKFLDGNSETLLKLVNNGDVELYYDDSKKFETQSTGVSVWGNLFMNNTDEQYLKFGAANDLVIYHHSNNWSYITHSGSGNLGIESANDISIRNTNGEKYVYCDKDGAAELYYDDSRKFRAVSSGTEVTGSEWITEGTIYLEKSGAHHHRILANDSGNDLAFQQSSDTGANTNFTTYLRIKDGGDIALPVDDKKLLLGAGEDLKIYHNGNDSIIADTGSGDLQIHTSSLLVRKADGTDKLIQANAAGAAYLFYDGSNKFETLTNGVKSHGRVQVTDGNSFVAGDGDDLKIQHSGSASFIDFKNGTLWIRPEDGSGSYEKGILVNQNGSVELYYDGTKVFETVPSGCELPDNSKLYLGTSGDLALHHDGSNSYIANTTGELFISASQVNIKSAAGEYMAYFNDNAEAALYYDDSKKFETTTNGVEISGFCSAFQVKDDSDHSTAGSNSHVFQVQNGAYNALIIEHASNSNPYGLVIDFSDFNPDNATNYFIKAQDSVANRFFVHSDGDVWTVDDQVLSSDETLKENIVDATSKLEDLKKLKVRNFNWKSSYHPEKSKKKQIGFIAQEVEEIFPSLISEHDIARGTPNDGHTPVMKKAIKQAWDPIIIKAMQELIEKIETLEAKVAALEAN